MEDYKSFVKTLAQNKVDRVFLNSDTEHAIEVLPEIFRISQSVVRIFAGSLCNEVGNAPEYIEALSDFIERDGEVRILLNKYDPELAKSSNLFKRLAYYHSENKNVSVKQTTTSFYRSNDPERKEVHFTLGDDHAYRIENDIEKRTATCNLNSPELTQSLIALYDNVFNREDTESINLSEMFS